MSDKLTDEQLREIEAQQERLAEIGEKEAGEVDKRYEVTNE